ncbi:PAS domain-containing protein [Streptomyces sp. WMMB 322]|uniref:PAS domain-containing protein n=1 Tax=Streptomyces sp. WMMB 322 TaxID=1286821 RepID=UPI0006E1F812|nr:PAS domain-containing protein [Streptomyces sp. WMMB 322]SCK07592.1 PAS domain S-box-containing protein [Streptomyces sp. WMMB 322]
MSARSRTHAASSSDGEDRHGPDDELLLAALLDGMDAALCAFDADGVVTHWNREAERLLGWTAEEAVGRQGLAGWALREADAEQVQARLFAAMHTPGRHVHEFALLTKDGRRLLVRTQASGVGGADGSPMGVYCAFSEVHAQIDLERSIALSECLFEDATWGVVLVDADLRPAVVNASAASAFRVSRATMLGRPLGELVDQGVEELEGALQHVLADGPPVAPAEIWVTLRSGRRTDEPRGASGEGSGTRRCWRSGFLRLSSPMAEAPVPLGVAWLFQDVTESKRLEQEADRLRFRDSQLHRAARAAAECENPMEAAGVHLDFALAGFADHALLDLVLPDEDGGDGPEAEDGQGLDADGHGASPRLVRVAATPAAGPGPVPPSQQGFLGGQGGRGGPGAAGAIPVSYAEGHPAHQAYVRCGSVRASVGGVAAAGTGGSSVLEGWAAARKWPDGTVHGLCTVLRSRGRTLGVVTFLRGASRRSFDRSDASYAEDIAVRIAAAVDMAQLTRAAEGSQP